MAERDLTLRLSPDAGTLELVGPPIGPAGVGVLDHGAVRLAFDLAGGGAVARIIVDGDEDSDLDRDAFLDALADAGVPVGPGDRGERRVTVSDDLVAHLAALGRLAVVDDVLRADRLTPVACLAATCEAAAMGLAAGGTLATTWHDAAERLWSVLGDPDADTLVGEASRPARAVLVDTLGRCLRTGDPLLDDAVADLHARWIALPGPGPTSVDHDPLEPLVPADAGPPPAPLMPAAAPAMAGAAPQRRARPARAEMADMAAAPGPRLTRVGDELRVPVPLSAQPASWIRVGLRDGRLLLAAVPVAAAQDGVARLPLDAAIPDHLLMVDVVADPAAPVRDPRGEAVAAAVAAGREAVAAERQGRLGAAGEAWRRCAAAWATAGDHPRARQATSRAAAPRLGRPLAHERISDAGG